MGNTFKAIAGGISYVKYYKVSLIKSLLVPFVLLAIITTLAFLPNIDSNSALAIEMLQWLPLTLIAITTHKVILEGPNSVPIWGINRFGAREFRFMGYEVLVVIVALPVLVFYFIPHLGGFLSMTAIAYIIGRLSLVFPSIAIGADVSLKESWVATKNYQLMMIVVVGLFPFLLGLLETLFASLPGMFWIGFVTSTFTTVFVVASLSVAYKIVMESQVVR
ncbi:MAG: hypothetical protein GY829_14300 [Gammaproteobacteria bacterium]|nr:hypothetical protein [Gammaproteobacteria bacterium]